jgi:hypothetical protein
MKRIGVPLNVRCSDLDANGHVHNAVYLTLLEEARVRAVRPLLSRTFEDGQRATLLRDWGARRGGETRGGIPKAHGVVTRSDPRRSPGFPSGPIELRCLPASALACWGGECDLRASSVEAHVPRPDFPGADGIERGRPQ